MGKQGIKGRKKHSGASNEPSQHKRLPPAPGVEDHGPDLGPITERSRQQAMAARAREKPTRDQLSVGQSKTVRVKRMSANQQQR